MMARLPLAGESSTDDPEVECIVVTRRRARLPDGGRRRPPWPRPGQYARVDSSHSQRRPTADGLASRESDSVIRRRQRCAAPEAGLHFVVDSDIAIASTAGSFVDRTCRSGQPARGSPSPDASGSQDDRSRIRLSRARTERSAPPRLRGFGLVSEVVEPDRLAPRSRSWPTRSLRIRLRTCVPQNALWVRSSSTAADQPNSCRPPTAIPERGEP